ncbi:MAG: thioesterase [Bacteriovoracaceae bacterium]|nr:thioesterase [Bacteriovoracaceae bacterium]
MGIWRNKIDLKDVQKLCENTMVSHLGMEILELGDDFIRGRMPVDHRTKQPAGLLHGGASVALAESLASLAGNFIVDSKNQMCVGVEINANHLKSTTKGYVEGISRPIHIGRTTQVWETKISRDDGELCCISRMTLAVVSKKRN